MNKLFFIISLLLTSFTLMAMSEKPAIFSTSKSNFISLDELTDELPTKGVIIFGEYHFNQNITNLQAKIMGEMIKKNSLENKTSLHWEFLHLDNIKSLNKFMKTYDEQNIDAFDDFILSIHPYKKRIDPTTGKTKTSKEDYLNLYRPYKVLFDQVIKSKSKMKVTNVPKAVLRVVKFKGLDAIPKEALPPNLMKGSDAYYERFEKTLEYFKHQHQDPNDPNPAKTFEGIVKRFYEAQYLKDSVMSLSVSKEKKDNLKFFTVGNFHVEFYDGLVRNLDKTLDQDIALIRFVSRSNIDKKDLKLMLSGHPKYGKYADFIVFTK